MIPAVRWYLQQRLCPLWSCVLFQLMHHRMVVISGLGAVQALHPRPLYQLEVTANFVPRCNSTHPEVQWPTACEAPEI